MSNRYTQARTTTSDEMSKNVSQAKNAYNKASSAKKFYNKHKDSINDFRKDPVNFASDKFNSAKESFNNAINSIGDKVNGALDNASKKLDDFNKDPQKQKQAAEKLKNFNKDLNKNVKEGAKNAWDKFKDGAGQLKNDYSRDAINEGAKKALDAVGNGIHNLADGAANYLKDHFNNLKQLGSDFANNPKEALKQYAKNEFDKLKDGFSGGKFKGSADKAKSAFEKAKNKIGNLKDGLANFAKDPKGTLKQALNNRFDKNFKQPLNQMKGGAKNLASKLKNAPANTLKAIKGIPGNVASKLSNAVKQAKQMVEMAIKMGKLIVKSITAIFKVIGALGPWAIPILCILLFGFAVFNIGVQQQAMSNDFVAYYNNACDSNPNSETCKNIKDPSKMSDEEMITQLLEYSAEEQYTGEVIILKDHIQEEYDETMRIILNMAGFFVKDKESLAQFDEYYLYTLDGQTFYKNPPSSLSFTNSSSSVSESDIFSSSDEFKDSDYNDKEYYGTVKVNDLSFEKLFTEEEAARIISAFIVSNGDSYPPREGDSSEYAISYYQNLLDSLTAANGTYYRISPNVTSKEYTKKIPAKKVSCSTTTVPVSNSDLEVEVNGNTVSSNRGAGGTPQQSSSSTSTSSTSNTSPTVVEYKHTCSYDEGSLNYELELPKVDNLYVTLSPVQTRPVASILLMLARYEDLKNQGETHYFQEDLLEDYGYKSMITETFLKNDKVYSVRDSCDSHPHSFDGYVELAKCLRDTTDEVASFYEAISNESFYRWTPAYYYECDHFDEAQKEPSCPHVLTEEDIAKLPSDKDWGKDRVAGDTCGAPVEKQPDNWRAAFISGAKKLFDNTLGAILNTKMPEAWIRQHSVYTYLRLEDEEGNPINEERSGDDITNSLDEAKRVEKERRRKLEEEGISHEVN